jgi:hypothetical protein
MTLPRDVTRGLRSDGAAHGAAGDESATGNILLDSLPRAQRQLLHLSLRRVHLTSRIGLDGKIVFPVDALLSMNRGVGRRSIEVGMIGSEGVMGLDLLARGRKANGRVGVIAAGAAYSIERDQLVDCLRGADALTGVLLLYACELNDQIAEAVLAAGRSSVVQRVARRLLMLQDRGQGSRFVTTHDGLAASLAVRRASVTIALQILEGDQLIVARRGSITLRDRGGLIALVSDIYTPLRAVLEDDASAESRPSRSP